MSKDYFKLFDLPAKLKLDHNKLKKNYFNLIRHNSKEPVINESLSKRPDKKEKELLKKAYETLKDRISRIEHLLEIKGFKVANDNKVPTVFEPLFEQVQSLMNNPKKGPKCLEDLKKLHKAVMAEFSTISIELAQLESEWDNSTQTNDISILKKLKRKTNALAFIKEVEQDLRSAMN